MNYNLELKVNSAIILAGGIGKRSNSSIPKQFIKINNKNRIIDYSINLLKKNQYIDEIIIVVCNKWQKIISDENKSCKVIPGGKSRMESAFFGLKACNKDCKNVLIHDAARPFISNSSINNIFQKLSKFSAIIPVLSNYDSVIKIKNKTLEYLNREDIKFVQTPQGFRYNSIFFAYIENNNQSNFQDDMSLLLLHKPNINYHILDGEQSNFKITSKDDITKAKKLLI